MFATLLGPLPRPPLDDAATPEAILAVVVQAQVDAGLELITDGGWPLHPDDDVASWRATAALTDRPVKAVVAGPLNAGLEAGASVDALRGAIAELASAGCSWVEVAEPAAVGIGTDEAARTRFCDLHDRLLDGLDGIHVSLAITGGSAADAGPATILGPPYASLAVDLIAGPDNWRLVTAAPKERGIVCGALSPEVGSDDGPEILIWALGYASSGRGSARVGLATASSMRALTWEAAVVKLARLGDAIRLATLPIEDRRRRLDPRAIDSRSAAMGRYTPRPERRRRG